MQRQPIDSNSSSKSKRPDSSKYTCYLGLGSNLTNEIGTPKEHIVTAVQKLCAYPDISHVQSSSLYVSEPYGVTDQPEFINAVVKLETSLSPQQLLNVCHELETQAKRQRLRHWGERTLDVDILLYGSEIIATKTLTIPHAEIQKRNFVLVPLAELDNNLNIFNIPIVNIAMSQDWTGLRLLDN